MALVQIDAETQCWVFHGQRNEGGYGRISVPGRRLRVAHRVTFEHYVGEVPEGLELDHLCRNTSCVNPDHLEPVTPQENCRRRVYRETTA